MELPDLTRPYPGRLQENNGNIDRIEASYDIIDYRTGLISMKFVDVFLPSHRPGSWG